MDLLVIYLFRCLFFEKIPGYVAVIAELIC